MLVSKEQTLFYKNYLNPIKFIMDFVNLYKIQSELPLKLSPLDVPHYLKFQDDLLEAVISKSDPKNYKNDKKSNFKNDSNKKSNNNSLNLKSNDNLFSCCDILNEIFLIKNDYEEFYTFCLKIIFKGINYKLDFVELEILDYNFNNFKLLYDYTLFNIDLSNHLAYKILKIEKIEDMVEEIYKLKEEIEEINKNLSEHKLCKHLEEMANTKPLLDIEFGISKGFEIDEFYNQIKFDQKMNEKSPKYKIEKNFKTQIDQEICKSIGEDDKSIDEDKNTDEDKETNEETDEETNKETDEDDKHLPKYSYVVYTKSSIKKASEFVKIKLDDHLIGSKRILKYDFLLILKVIAEGFVSKYSKASSSNAYVNIMKFAGEITIFNGTGNISETLKEYANYLLVENYTK